MGSRDPAVLEFSYDRRAVLRRRLRHDLPCAGDRSVQRLADGIGVFELYRRLGVDARPAGREYGHIRRSSQGGFWGALVATLGVVLPSFLLLLLIAAVLRNLMKYRGVEAFLSGVRPCVVALILATAVTMGLTRLLGFTHLGDVPAPDIRSLLVLAVLAAVHFLWKKLRGKVPSPIAMIGLSAVLGILLWSI